MLRRLQSCLGMTPPSNLRTSPQRNPQHSFSHRLLLQSQYNAPVADVGTFGIPANRVQTACELFSDSTLQGSDLLGNMALAMGVFTANSSLANGCLDITGAAPEPEPEPYGPTEAPASGLAELAPEPEPEESDPYDAVFQLSAGDRFAYQVRHTCLLGEPFRLSGEPCFLQGAFGAADLTETNRVCYCTTWQH